MIDQAILISILAFIGTVIFIIGISSFLKYQKEHRDVVKKIEHDGEMQTVKEATTLAASGALLKQHVMQIVGQMGNFVKPKKEGELSHVEKTFLRAGYRNKNVVVIFFGVKGFCAILMAVFCFLLQIFLFKTMSPLRFMFLFVLLALAGFYLPNIWLRMKIDQRKEKIAEGFPDALDLLVVCVEAGVGLDAAINRVADEMKQANKEISDEFQLLNLELKAGKARRDALKSLAMRIDLEDVKNLVTLLVQTDRFGTSVGPALRVYSDVMRTKRFQKAEEAAAKVPVKLLFPLIFCIFPSLFIAIMGPAAIRIWKMKHGG